MGALKQGHVVLHACYCQSRIWGQHLKEPWVRHSGKVSAGMTFLLKVLFICSIIITAYTFYNNSNILHLENSLEFTSAFHALSHTILWLACLSVRDIGENWAQEIKLIYSKPQSCKELEPGFEPRFSILKTTSLYILQELPRKIEAKYIGTYDYNHLHKDGSQRAYTITLTVLVMVLLSCTELKCHEGMLKCLLNQILCMNSENSQDIIKHSSSFYVSWNSK